MKRIYFWAAICLLLLSSCGKSERRIRGERLYYTNLFANQNMATYYYWVGDPTVSANISRWYLDIRDNYLEDPVGMVESCRYQADQWTALFEDAAAFESSVTGQGQSFGFEAGISQDHDKLVILFAYEGSPADKAGLKRGDVFSTVNGTQLADDNYTTVIAEAMGGSTIELGREGKSVTLQSSDRYDNPIVVSKVLEIGGKKIGYLFYTSFTLVSARDLVATAADFKSKGIDDLVLDLRYNTGGYTITANVLASLLAPASAVKSGAVWTKDTFNSRLMEVLDKEVAEGRNDRRLFCFASSFELPQDEGTISLSGANLDLSRLWVITSKNTASASEALICGLKPYMNVKLVGQQTYGKYCGGSLIKGEDWYDAIAKGENKAHIKTDLGKSYTTGWGIYVISTKFTDRDGNNAGEPDGFPADVTATDNPADGFQLGDPQESMLATVLSDMGVASKAPTKAAIEGFPVEIPQVLLPTGFGVYITEPLLIAE